MTEVAYLWVRCKKPAAWLVSEWDGEPYWLDVRGARVRPDREFGKPVVRRIGSGYLAEHYRFEWSE